MKIRLTALFIVSAFFLSAQNDSSLKVMTKREKGIEVTQVDSLFSLNFQFRMQNRLAYMSISESDLTPESFEMRVRRCRMKFSGFVYNPKISYYLQLSFSRGDMDWESSTPSVNNTSPNIVRDAIIFYKPNPSFTLGFGQTKLPGNRQRVVSSGNLQFADRSIVNSTLTLDRDFGLFGTWQREYYACKAAITSGEGRNSVKSDEGLNYTARIEILPFGRFAKENDYSEGDLAREQKLKLSLAGTYNYNANAIRQGGTIGNDLYTPVNMQHVQIDGLLKFKGFALYQEYCNRISDKIVTVDPNNDAKTRTVFTGFGSLTQISYLFKTNYEIAARYALIMPNKSNYNNNNFLFVNDKRQEQIHLGLTKYLYGHRLKVQGNLLYHISKDLKNELQSGKVGAIFQIELGI